MKEACWRRRGREKRMTCGPYRSTINSICKSHSCSTKWSSAFPTVTFPQLLFHSPQLTAVFSKATA
jgi:hypothetical protein